jgi:surfeit locus 1 family protein
MKRRAWPVLLAASLGLVILLALGTWQVQRLAWKEALLADLAKAALAPPVDLDTALQYFADGSDVNNLRVAMKGKPAGPPEFLLTSFHGQPGWHVVQPISTNRDTLLLVDLGQIAENERATFSLPATELQLVGQLRQYNAERGIFDGTDDPVGHSWYSWNAVGMAKAVAAAAGKPVLPLILHIQPEHALANGPVPKKLTDNLRNNHLGYAITWFGLAATLAVIAGFYLWQMREKR